MHRVTLVPGDGTGPELTEATRRVLEATGVEFEWDVQPAGEGVMASQGTPLPRPVLDSIRRNPHHKWVADNDPFKVNQFGHPYQGSMYHGFARSAGLDFWPSLGYTFLTYAKFWGRRSHWERKLVLPLPGICATSWRALTRYWET